jgi:hypothetical protein
MTEQEPIIKYSSYTDAQKKATTKYRLANKEKVNEKRKQYYQKRKEDPNFLEYKRAKAREYYQTKKIVKPIETEQEPIVEPEIVKEEEKAIIDLIKEVEQIEQAEIKKQKRIRKPKAINII